MPALAAIALACTAALLPATAHAAGNRAAQLPQQAVIEIYKMVDENGKVTYSNLPIKGAVKLDLDPITIIPAPRTALQVPAAAPAPITAALATTSLPNVDGPTQRRRDDIRRKILEEEIRDEQKQLSDAREQVQSEETARAELIRTMKAATARQDLMASLEARRAYDQREDKLKSLNEIAASHETNIDAIRKELGALK